MNTETVQARAARLVSIEVHSCISSLVSTLAPHWGAMDLTRDTTGLADLFEQAGHLTLPIPDYEEAAREAGWNNGPNAWSNLPNEENYWGKDGEVEAAGNVKAYLTAEELCDSEGIEPYDREVFEHWAVSDWLADKLIEHGEKVDKDFAGLNVWARTTTGQAISIDSVIETIARELLA